MIWRCPLKKVGDGKKGIQGRRYSSMENLHPFPSLSPKYSSSQSSSETLSGEAQAMVDEVKVVGLTSSKSPSIVIRSSKEGDKKPKSSGDDGEQQWRGRKGHTKSRRGCYNCKRARIKVCKCPFKWGACT
jgi:hypothetical protein